MVTYLAKLTAKHYTIDMAKGPKGEKRHADTNRNAVLIAKIATGEINDSVDDEGKSAAAVSLGRRGGMARALGLTDKERTEIAQKAAKARWNKNKS